MKCVLRGSGSSFITSVLGNSALSFFLALANWSYALQVGRLRLHRFQLGDFIECRLLLGGRQCQHVAIAGAGSALLLKNAKNSKYSFCVNGIVLVRMAMGTSQRRAKPHGGRRVNAIDHGGKAELQRIDAPFFVDHRVAVKAGGNPLVQRGIRQAYRRQAARS